MTIESSESRAAAHFRVCQCGQHGSIVTADRQESDDVSTMERALELAFEFYAWGKISAEEMPGLIGQITGSRLPNNADDIQNMILTAGKAIIASLQEIADSLQAKGEEIHRDTLRPEEWFDRAEQFSSEGKPRIH